jgi:hypothetical protein
VLLWRHGDLPGSWTDISGRAFHTGGTWHGARAKRSAPKLTAREGGEQADATIPPVVLSKPLTHRIVRSGV